MRTSSNRSSGGTESGTLGAGGGGGCGAGGVGVGEGIAGAGVGGAGAGTGTDVGGTGGGDGAGGAGGVISTGAGGLFTGGGGSFSPQEARRQASSTELAAVAVAEGAIRTMEMGRYWEKFVPAKRHGDERRVHSDLVSETS
ncbi:hypothetical protein [Verrucomicrobium sp. BvORR034]|uniref:hypothetical protein n=1 Tax=Verrucomicrobium sp. BvORR034 TaxID=1396418 RepID=UPI000678E602|nr:hypothetical protein [Verrucomicrobium sp. BvORR034]